MFIAFENNEKINFVDSNNVFVGYDMGQCCCESAGWFISKKMESEVPDAVEKPDTLPGWVFDRNYNFKEVTNSHFDEGGMVVFRLVNGSDEKFLHLYNIHNGYYGHGFTFEIDDSVKVEGAV